MAPHHYLKSVNNNTTFGNVNTTEANSADKAAFARFVIYLCSVFVICFFFLVTINNFKTLRVWAQQCPKDWRYFRFQIQINGFLPVCLAINNPMAIVRSPLKCLCWLCCCFCCRSKYHDSSIRQQRRRMTSNGFIPGGPHH